jgi:hypothetical protein
MTSGSISNPGSLVQNSTELKAEDYCWIVMARSKKIDYCSKVSDEKAREFCLEEIR